jgi:hypothetical protein
MNFLKFSNGAWRYYYLEYDGNLLFLSMKVWIWCFFLKFVKYGKSVQVVSCKYVKNVCKKFTV